MGYVVLIASVVVQILAALAATFIVFTRPPRTAYLLASAVGLLAVQRVYALASALYEHRDVNTSSEVLPLVIAVFMLSGLLGVAQRFRLQRVNTVTESTGVDSNRLRSLAITFGLLGLVTSVVVAMYAYQASRTAVFESVKLNMLSVARSFRDLAVAGVRDEEDPILALEELSERWKALGRGESSGHLLLLRMNGVVALHTASPEVRGQDLADRRIVVTENRQVTFGELGKKPEDLVGMSHNPDGLRELTAVVPAPRLDALICWQVSADDVDARVVAASLPWAAGMGLATLVLLPLSLLMFHRAYSASQEELAASHIELATRENRLQQIIQNMPVMMWALGDDGNVVAWNRECERVTGYGVDEIAHNPMVWEKLFPNEDDRSRVIQGWRDRCEDYRDWEWELMCKDGTLRTIAWSSCSIEFPIRGWSNWTIGVDVTDRKRLELKARQTLAQLSRVARARSLGAMATGIAHELNQPLTAIVNYAQGGLIRIRGGSYEATEIESAMDRIAVQAHRAGDIIKRIRGFVSKGEYQPALADINEIVRSVTKLLEPETITRNIEIVLDLEDSLPKLSADYVQIQQVLVNLVQNGIEAFVDEIAEPRRVEVATSLTEDGRVRTTVRDYGCGLSEESLRFALDPFFTTKVDGLGMGLSISRSIIEAHQGVLAVDSGCTPGARFQFTLPVAGGMEEDGPGTDGISC